VTEISGAQQAEVVMQTFYAIGLFLVVCGVSAAELEHFHSPVHIQADGKPLDVEREGHSAPFVGDLDGDGIRDLLVGQYHQGRLRIYRNLGSNAEPRFADFQWLQAGGQLGKVPTSCCVGFTPQLVDLDGDGLTDILSGSYPGDLYFFRRQRDGTFSAGEHMQATNGKALYAGEAATAFAVDWDANETLDLLLGDINGYVYLARRNKGLTFDPPEKLSVAGKPIEAPGGNSAPVAADWDGDGLLDLVVGSAEGNVDWFRNQGRPSEPRLEAGRPLLGESLVKWGSFNPKRPDQWGLRVKPCVIDWNGDGKLDLLLGDRCGSFEGKPAQTDEELQEEQAAHDRLPGVRQAWAAAFAEYQRESAANADPQRIERLRRQVASLKGDIAQMQEVRDRYEKGYQSHGFVWLFLRK